MKMKSSLLAISCFFACLLTASVGFAQNRELIPDNVPVDGQMVRLDAKKLWHLSYLPNLAMKNVQKISDDVRYPAISPNGDRVISFKPDKENPNNNTLHEWNANSGLMSEIARGNDLSRYVSWTDDSHFDVREREKPFFRDGAKLKFEIEKKPVLRNKIPLVDNTFVAYDEDDVIILESKKTKTLQAISDAHADRYFAPIVSPDEKFVVFSSLTSGIHLFDIEANAVVFIGSHGNAPAFSPDGKYLIYADIRDDGHNYTSGDLILVNLKDRSYRVISNVNREIRTSATLSRDAKFIAYSTDDGSVWRASINLE